jgi:hypothetical protein
VVLDADHRARLDEASAIRLPFPHNMIRPFRPANVLTHRPDQH